MDATLIIFSVVINGIVTAQQNRMQDVIDMSVHKIKTQDTRFRKTNDAALGAAMTPPSQYVKELVKYGLTVFAVIDSFLMHWYLAIVVILGVIVAYRVADYLLPFQLPKYYRRIASTLETREQSYAKHNSATRAKTLQAILTRFRELYSQYLPQKIAPARKGRR